VDALEHRDNRQKNGGFTASLLVLAVADANPVVASSISPISSLLALAHPLVKMRSVFLSISYSRSLTDQPNPLPLRLLLPLPTPRIQPWAFESREFLRARLVGKEITFTISHSLPPSSSTPASADDAPVSRDIGAAELAGRDIASEVLKNGWAKLKELKRDREPTEEDTRKKELEAEARSAGLGVWNPHGQTARAVHHTMPVDSAAFMAEWKGKPLDGIVEQVKDGSTLRVRLFLPEGDHQVVNLALAGVRSARAAGKPGESSEPFGEEVSGGRSTSWVGYADGGDRANTSQRLVFCSVP
jgi:hypothetical protein